MKLRIIFSLLIAWALACCNQAYAQDVQAETIVEGLNRPVALAQHPDDGTIYVAEYGANRVSKVVEGKPVQVVTDFASHSVVGWDSEGGPVALGFSHGNWLLVAPATEKEKTSKLLGFNLGEMEEGKPFTAASAQATLEVGPEDNRLVAQILRIYSQGSLVYLAGQKPDKRGFVLTVNKADAAPAAVDMLMPKKMDAERWVPPNTSLTVSSPEGYLAIIERSFKGSALTFYSDEGEENGMFVTGLNDVKAIAYGPKLGRLYLADQETGAIYKLVEADNDEGCKSVEVYKLANISDMQFNDQGDLLVTTLGTDQVGDDTGKVIKLTGLDEEKSDEEKAGE